MHFKTTTAEAKLYSYELEVLAVIKAIKKFRIYLIGIPFKIVMDCQAFALTFKKADGCAELQDGLTSFKILRTLSDIVRRTVCDM